MPPAGPERFSEEAGESGPESSASLPPDAGTAEAEEADGRTLILRVERDGFPASGLPVWIHPRYEWRSADRADVRGALPAGALYAETDSLGRVEFTGLGRDPFRVGLCGASLETAGPGSARPDRYPSIEAYPGFEYTLAIGSASVFGTVFDAEGRPLPGVGLQISNAEPDEHHNVLAVQALTDDLGRYELAHLAAGEHVIAMEPDGRFDGKAEGAGEVWKKELTLEVGEVRQLDFGSPSGRRHWTGRLLNAFDEPFEGTGNLWLKEVERGERVTVPVGASGRFDAALTAGLWQVHAHCTGSPSGGFDLGRHRVERDHEHDLRVPGIRLRGRLTPPTWSRAIRAGTRGPPST